MPDPLDEPETLVGVCVQLNVAPAGVLVRLRAVGFPEQIDIGPETATVGMGLTTRLIAGVENGPEQLAFVMKL